MADSKLRPPVVADTRGEHYLDLVKHFAGTAVSNRSGRVLLAIWTLGSAGSIVLGIIGKAYFRKQRQRKANEDKQTEEQKKNQPRREGLINQLKRILPIAFPSLVCPSSLYLAANTVLLISRILLTIKIAKITGKLGKMIGARTFTKMFQLQLIFGLWCVPAAVMNSLLAYTCDKLSLAMRTQLIKYIHNNYFSNLVFYRAANVGKTEVDDFDQRTSQDLKKFCSSASELYGNLLKPICELFLISHSLSQLMGAKHLAGFFLFFIMSGQWLRFVMPPFAQIHADTQKMEGEFRTHHTRVIAHSEEIAFYGGSEREKEIVNNSFKSVVKVADKHHFLQMLMSVLDSYLVKYGASMVAYSMLIPAVYLGQQGLKGKSTAYVMQYYLTSTQLFIALGNACKHLVLSYKRIQALSGLTIRITELFELLKKRQSYQIENELKETASKHPLKVGGAPVVKEGDNIKFEDVDIFTPAGQLLITGLNFEVKKNTNVLISGRNGSGKSTIFRVLAGLFPLCSGTLTRPKQGQLFYVPQKPYMSPGSLRDQVTYPIVFKTKERDEELFKLMELVDLGYLVKREGWDCVKDWADVLSGGEKQRVAMARLFYHKPAFGILDECTSAVSVDVEAKIYETCKELGITIFTVSHRPQLMHHHDYMLKLDGEGKWEWSELKHDE